ncbi:universal stress protein [Actinacidiphila oryziradicis]|uniref:Universal stress protein n=1 Tax=Actinacidiphila oryziradicis TaxID=2571141 RepID=A0A4U0RTZ4_9ACTN|nr:universal stress protein [Actinacidiphila oryziradicis]TJZ99579.1 universal stress protein [Actinacidiphila oryziradicis]
MNLPVVAGIDGSARSLAAADWAAREAALRRAPLRLVHAAPSAPGPVMPVTAAEVWQQVGEEVLRHAVADLGERYPDLVVRGEQVSGRPADTLLSAAANARLLVVGARGTGGFDGLVMGSVALRAAAAAACPVVVVPEQPADANAGDEEAAPVAGGSARVVTGLDAHEPVDGTADFAFAAARRHYALLRVVHAWTLPAASVSPLMLDVTEEDRATWEDQEVVLLSDALREWREKYPGVAVQPDVRLLHPAMALVTASSGADLLVIGRRTEPRAPEGRLGPVAHAVLHHARCPVAIVPHAG